MIDADAAIHGALLARGRRRLDTVFGGFDLSEFHNLETQRGCFALSVGDLSGEAPVLARVHSSCVTSEFFGACDCDCAAQLDDALEAIAAQGRGLLFYLEQEGRGAGLAAKARDRMLVQASRQRLTTFEAYERMGLKPDLRRYDEVAAMAVLLGIDAPFVLLTNNPEKAAALEREKVRVARLQPLEHKASPFNVHYLSAKRSSGHVLEDASGTLDAELPQEVEEVAPEVLPTRPELVRIARYLLPVRPAADPARGRGALAAGDPVWLSLHLYIDAERGGERVVLTADGDAPTALARIHAEPLLERFPLRATPARRSWAAVVDALARHGRGAVAFQRRGASANGAGEREDDAAAALLAHHLAADRVVPLRAADEPDLGAALRRAGLEVEPDRALPG